MLSVYRVIVPVRNTIFSAEEEVWTLGQFTTSGRRVIWEHSPQGQAGFLHSSQQRARLGSVQDTALSSGEEAVNWTGFQNQSNVHSHSEVPREAGRDCLASLYTPSQKGRMFTSLPSTPFHNPMQAHRFLQMCYVLVFILKMVPCIKNVQ